MLVTSYEYAAIPCHEPGPALKAALHAAKLQKTYCYGYQTLTASAQGYDSKIKIQGLGQQPSCFPGGQGSISHEAGSASRTLWVSHLCLTRRCDARTVCFCCILLSEEIAVSALRLEPVRQSIRSSVEHTMLENDSHALLNGATNEQPLPVVSPRNMYFCCEEPKVMGVLSASKVGLFGGNFRSFMNVP